MSTPDQEVADRVVTELRKQNLLSEAGIKKIEKGLAMGNLTSEDWRLAFESDRDVEKSEHAD